jgi:hypothetical protein
MGRTRAMVVAAVVAMAGCGGSDGDTDGGPAGSLPDLTLPGGGELTLPEGGDDTFPLPEPAPQTFVDLPGTIRFGNFLSDGTAGVDIDLYWGFPPATGEFVVTIPYGTVSDFVSPRRVENAFGDANEATYWFLPAGSDPTTVEQPTWQSREFFDPGSRITTLIAADAPAKPDVSMMFTAVSEHEIAAAPSDAAHVYSWDRPWDSLPDKPFAVVGYEGECSPEQGEGAGGNVGTPARVPPGSAGVTLFDANSECASGAAPAEESVEAGRSYVLIGLAPSVDPAARTTMLLEVGA